MYQFRTRTFLLDDKRISIWIRFIMQTILTFWPDNSQHQLCWEIKYASYARDLNGKPHLINMLVFVHTEENMLNLFPGEDMRGEPAGWRNIEIFMYSEINPANTLHVSTSVHSDYGYYRRSVSSIRASTDHWICLLIEFHIFKNNLRCFVLKSDTCQNLSF